MEEILTKNSTSVIEFLSALQEKHQKVHTQMFPYHPVNEFYAEDREKNIAVFYKEKGNDRKYFQWFIAKQTQQTKQLGKIRQGDILKPKSFVAPARGARGNLFNAEKGLGRLGLYGPEYNKESGSYIKI